MSLDPGKLEKVRRLEGGIVQARCPACAEGGHDRTGEHLRVYPDGKFGCCVHPKDREHRKRIFALAGAKAERQAIRVKVAGPQATGILHRDVLGRLGRVFGGVAKGGEAPVTPFGTLGTPTYPSAYGENKLPEGEEYNRELIGFGPCVPSVPSGPVPLESETPVPSVPKAAEVLPPIVAGEKLPYFTPGGTLVIPHDSPARYHWWKGGMHVWETRAEARARAAGAGAA